MKTELVLENFADRIDVLFQSKDVPEDNQVKDWTELIFKTVAEMIPDERTIFPYDRTLSSQEQGEYLLDHVWSIEEGSSWQNYKGLLLAMECEWGGSDESVWEDFVKLVDIRAKFKIFVGTYRRWQEVDDFVRQLAVFFKGHIHSKDTEEILLILEKKGGGEYRAWILSGSGHIRQYYQRYY